MKIVKVVESDYKFSFGDNLWHADKEEFGRTKRTYLIARRGK
jgi:hypothetical protein